MFGFRTASALHVTVVAAHEARERCALYSTLLGVCHAVFPIFGRAGVLAAADAVPLIEGLGRSYSRSAEELGG